MVLFLRSAPSEFQLRLSEKHRSAAWPRPCLGLLPPAGNGAGVRASEAGVGVGAVSPARRGASPAYCAWLLLVGGGCVVTEPISEDGGGAAWFARRGVRPAGGFSPGAFALFPRRARRPTSSQEKG